MQPAVNALNTSGSAPRNNSVMIGSDNTPIPTAHGIVTIIVILMD